MLTDSIAKIYRKTTNKIYSNTTSEIYSKINKKAKAIVNNYKIAKGIDCLLITYPFITLKDHKPNFITNPKCRLINPSKSELGKVSKFLNKNVNTKIRVNH